MRVTVDVGPARSGTLQGKQSQLNGNRLERLNETGSVMSDRPLQFRYGRFHLGVLAALLTIVCTSHHAWAFEESAKAKVRVLYEQAKADLEAHRYCEAANGFNSALEAIPLPVLALWAARASAKCGDLVAAMVAYTKATQLTSNDLWADVKQQRAQVEAADELALLRKRIPRVVVKVTQSDDTDIKVAIDGQALPPEKLGTEVPVNPGTHVLAYTKNNVTTEQRVSVVEQQLLIVPLGQSKANDAVPALIHAQGENEAAAVPAPTITHSPANVASASGSTNTPVASPAPSESRYKAATMVATVIGSAGLAAGLVTRLMAFNEKATIDAHCDPFKQCDAAGMDAVSRANSLQIQSTIYLLVGTAGIATAIGYAIAGKSEPSSQARLTPLVLPAGAGLRLERSF
jgi:septum formation topological specificity factor MinE